MKSLGAYADELFALQAEIKAKEAAIAPLKATLLDLKNEAIVELHNAEQSMAAGKLGKMVVKTNDIPFVPAKQWDMFHEYVHANRAFHLLHKRISTTAVMELLKGGEMVDGVEILSKQEIKVSGL